MTKADRPLSQRPTARAAANPPKPLALALAVAMARDGMNNAALAAETGMSTQTIGRIRKGHTPDDTNLASLMRYLNRRGWGLLLVTETFEYAIRDRVATGLDPRQLHDNLTGSGPLTEPPYSFGDEQEEPPRYALPPQMREIRRFFELLAIARNEENTPPRQRTELLRSDYRAVNATAEAIAELYAYQDRVAEWQRSQFQPGGWWYERNKHRLTEHDTPGETESSGN